MTPGSTSNPPKRIRNIADLARIAGVSAGTVSRALADKDLVNRQTRERIQALAREHGFRPNQMASRLRTGHTGVIGVVMPAGPDQAPSISDPFFMTLLEHVADCLSDKGYDIMLSRVANASEADWLDRIVDSGMVDGVLLIGQADQFETVERVADRYRPLVVWGEARDDQKHCAVGSDNFTGGRLAVEHLLARGARRIAFLGESPSPAFAQRLAGARAAIENSGIGATLSAHPVPHAPDAMADGISAIIDNLDPATNGIFAATDLIAMSALRLLQQGGRRVPEDTALIGYDDLPLAMQTMPQLTTVRQDIAGAARIMVENLLQRIGGTDTASSKLQPQLIVRGSA